tara:strand:- start:1264 stop:2619 length:1356 start_codon:yes stop_codon:yes gene_type:complete
MIKKSLFGILVVLILFVFATGCDSVQKKSSSSDDFKRGPSGLVMNFIPNYPGDKYTVTDTNEDISVVVDVRNKGTYPPESAPGNGKFSSGKLYLSGFDDRIIDMSGLTEEDINKMKSDKKVDISDLEEEAIYDVRDSTGFFSGIGLDSTWITDDNIADRETTPLVIDLTDATITDEQREKFITAYQKARVLQRKAKPLSEMFLPAASPINPTGSLDSAEFDGEIVSDNILVDSYDPKVLITACYPYVTKASPTVCIDPNPFDDLEEKVCNIGSQNLETQGAPIAVTEIEQEASTNKIQFKIHIKNVGDGDVLKTGVSAVKDKDAAGNEIEVNVLDRCSPLSGGKLDRKDFDRVQVTKINVGDVDLWNVDNAATPDVNENKCSPFADGTDDIIRLFDGEGFVICTLNLNNGAAEGVFTNVESAYTTPITIGLSYSYRSTISKQIEIKKLETR